MKSEEQLNNKLIENIRNTLKARLIANLPADCEGSHGMASGYGYVRKFVADTSYVRKFVADTIDRFEFDWYLKEARQQGRVEERKKIIEELEKIKNDCYYGLCPININQPRNQTEAKQGD
jgi:hypothetical protein